MFFVFTTNICYLIHCEWVVIYMKLWCLLLDTLCILCLWNKIFLLEQCALSNDVLLLEAGESGGGLSSGTFERQMEDSGNGASLINLIWAHFQTHIMLGVWIWGHSGTSVKDMGSHDLASENWGIKGLFKAYVHWDWNGSNPYSILFDSELEADRLIFGRLCMIGVSDRGYCEDFCAGM
jgi:hypothetical protein